MLTGPVPVTEKVLATAGMTIDDIDLFEVNEAFAAVVLRFLQAFDLERRPGQRQRRRDRHGPSAGRDGRDDPRDRARRAGADAARARRSRRSAWRAGWARRRSSRGCEHGRDRSGAGAAQTGSIYPEPYASMVAGRSSLRLGDAGGLTQFGANIVILQPGARSSLRHWHVQRGRVRDGDRGRGGPGAGRGRVRDAPRRLRGLPGGRHERALLLQPDRPTEARFLVVGTAPRARSRTTRTWISRSRSRAAAARFTYRDGSPWDGPR